MSEPRQKPGKSRQDFGTPMEFIDAVVKRFGPLAWDLAAHAGNHKCDLYFDETANSLRQDWTQLRGNLWLNPPFGDIGTWARKCAESVNGLGHGTKILMLTPASVGSNWFAEHVHHRALVLGVNPRMSFDGKDPYPKDLMLSVFGVAPGFDVWRWKGADVGRAAA